MPDVLVIGGGLAGLATAAALSSAGFKVDVHEARPFLGGRATSYSIPAGDGTAETLDNCQHILLRCCVNLMDFYRRLNVEGKIEFHREFHFMEPGGRTSTLRAGRLPAPFHFAESFAGLRFLSMWDKVAVGRALLALRKEAGRRKDLDRITMLDWLREKRQTARAIERFWGPVLVSAINEELGRMAATHGFQVFRLGFLSRSDAYEMGIPAIPLGELYAPQLWQRVPGVELHLRSTASRLLVEDGRATGVDAGGVIYHADFYVSALPFERLAVFAPTLTLDLQEFEHSPITGVHLWFDRPVTELPYAALLDRTIQWFFNKAHGQYLQLVISASHTLLTLPRGEVIDLALAELREYLPQARAAKLVKAHVVKEARATFSAKPGMESRRPRSQTPIANFFLAGDWTRSGWPATMEGAVRSGYLAAEAVTAAAGNSRNFVVPDIA